MIIDRLENIASYKNLGGAFAEAAAWLEQIDPKALPWGRTEIAGERVFATLSENRLSREETGFEAHRIYADIQLVLEGKERFLFGLETEILPPNPGTDFYPCRVGRRIGFTLEAGELAIFLPGEAHAPGIAPEDADSCKKLVVKVRTQEPETH